MNSSRSWSRRAPRTRTRKKARRLEIENAALRLEIEELKAEIERLGTLVQDLEAPL